MAGTVKQIASIAALAASGAGAVGAGSAALGTGAGGTSSTIAAGSTAMASSSAGVGPGSEALSHLSAAQSLTQQAATFDAMGLHAPAQFSRSMAHSHEISARQVELSSRMQQFSGSDSGGGSHSGVAPDFGFAPNVNTGIATTFSGSQADFQKGFESLSPQLSQHGLTPELFASQYPEDTGRMVQAYLAHGADIQQAQDPLFRAGELGKIEKAREVIEFTPMNWRAGDSIS